MVALKEVVSSANLRRRSPLNSLTERTYTIVGAAHFDPELTCSGLLAAPGTARKLLVRGAARLRLGRAVKVTSGHPCTELAKLDSKELVQALQGTCSGQDSGDHVDRRIAR